MTLSIAQLIAVLILGCSSFLSGWMLRRIQAKSREAQLQKDLAEAQGSIPSLETNVRNRDQRIASLFAELTEWKTKVPTLEAASKRKDADAAAKEREIRALRVEVDALKATVAATPVPDPAKLEQFEAIRESLAAAQARCAELKSLVVEQEARLATVVAPVPSFIALPVPPATPSEAELMARIDALSGDVTARDRRIEELAAALNAAIEAGRVANEERDSRTAENDRVRAESTKWQLRVPKLVATIKARDAALAERDAELADRSQQASMDLSELAQQRTLNASLQSSLQGSEARAAELASQLALASANCEALARTIDERDHTASVLEQRVALMTQELDIAAAQHAMKLATALRLGREEVDSHQSELERANAERNAQSARAARLEEELSALKASYGQLATSAADESQRHSAAESELRSRHAALELQVAQAHEQQVSLESQLAQVQEQRVSLESQLTHAHEQYASVDRELGRAHDSHTALEQRLAEERQQRDEGAANVDALQRMRTALESRLAEAEAAAVALERQIGTLQGELSASNQRALDVARQADAQVDEEIERQTAELVELRDEARTLHTRIAPLESLLKQRDSALSERAERIDALTAQLQGLNVQNESLQATLRQRGERIAALERKFSDQPVAPAAVPEPADRRGDHLEQRLVAQIERNRELAKVVEERDHDLATASKKNDLNEKSMLVLKQQLDDARASEERLAGQLRELKAASQRAPEADATAAKSTMSKPNGLFELPPEHIDELQQIRGIGDGFERGLNKLGIYQFSQLAGLSAQEIAWVEAHLPTFNGRVERDDWPGQAAALMAASEHAEWSLRAQNPASASHSIN